MSKVRLLSSNCGIKTHFCRRFPMKSCRPIRAKTLRQNTVRTMASASFLIDWMRAPTIVFSPNQPVNSIIMNSNFKIHLKWSRFTQMWISDSHLPGMTVMVFKARRTLKVLKTETFPKSTNSVKYLQWKHTVNLIIRVHGICSKWNTELRKEATHAILMTMKSSQFQGSLRKVNCPTQKPLDRIFMVASNV